MLESSRAKLKTITVMLAPALMGCDKIPGTAAYQIEQAKADVTEQLIDPTSPLFRKVRVNSVGNAVCGEYNTKNKAGAYTGFAKFFVVKTPYTEGLLERANLDPEYDKDLHESMKDSCRLSRQAGALASQYGVSSGSLTSELGCKDAEEYGEAFSRQVDFDKGWWKLCYYNGTPPAFEKWLQD